MKNKKLVITVISILVVIGAALAYVALRPLPTAENNTATKEQPAPPTDTNFAGDEPASMAKVGKYINYTEESFADAKDSRRVLFFHAAWCPQCRALEASIKEGQIPAGMAILKVDYDNSDQLKQKYGVTLQTTLVEVDANGNLKKKFVAYDEPSLATLKREFK